MLENLNLLRSLAEEFLDTIIIMIEEVNKNK